MMKFVKIIVYMMILLSSVSAEWADEQNVMNVEDILNPSDTTVIEDDTVVEAPSDNGWTTVSSSEQIEDKATQSSFIGLINGKSYGNYFIEKIYRKKALENFYAQNGYSYFWFKKGFSINPKVKSLIKAIEEAPTEILNDLNRYHYDEIITYISQIKENSYSRNEKELLFKTLDILLSDAFFNLAHDLHNGILDYQAFQQAIREKRLNTEINYKWDTPKSEPDYSTLLINAYTTNSIKKDLYDLVNHNLVYERLKEAYFKYQDIVNSGGWVKIPAGKTLRYGSKGKRVNLLAKRLAVTGDLINYHQNYNKFDKALKNALKKYQRRMGLWVSSTLTAETRRSLNISARAKLKLIKLNIEKARWETDLMQGRFIIVNIPDFMLRFFDGDRVILASRVVCGRKKNPTPIFSSVMSYVVLNPTWTVPDSIIKKEMIDKFEENPNYLADKSFKIYDGWGKNRKEVDPSTIDWSKYKDKNKKVPYAIVRTPGKENPLGIVKFMFPNNNAVYIHDTPSKSLFKKRVRAFSHGCVRLHNPNNLLELVANEYITLGYSKVKKLLKSGENKSLGLSSKIPVYIRYYTVFVTDDGSVKFSYDIYGYDRILLKNII